MPKNYLLIVTLLLIGLLMLTGCSGPASTVLEPITGKFVSGEGSVKTEERPPADFKQINITGKATVTLHKGKTLHIIVEAQENLLPLLESRVENGILYLGARSGTIVDRGTVDYDITYTTFTALRMSGDNNRVEMPEFYQDHLSVEQSGTSMITIQGAIDMLTVSSSGSSYLSAKNLIVQKADITETGSADVEITAQQSLNATLSGSAVLRYSGTAQVNQNVSGSAVIEKAN